VARLSAEFNMHRHVMDVKKVENLCLDMSYLTLILLKISESFNQYKSSRLSKDEFLNIILC